MEVYLFSINVIINLIFILISLYNEFTNIYVENKLPRFIAYHVQTLKYSYQHQIISQSRDVIWPPHWTLQ